MSHSCDLGPAGSDQGPFHSRDVNINYIISVTKDGVRVPVVNCMSFYSCQTMNNGLLKFLDVNKG